MRHGFADHFDFGDNPRMNTAPSTLEQGDALAAKGATAPRVTLEGMQQRIVAENYWQPGHSLTICVILLDNGWTLVGKSACADPANFDEDKGRTFARDDALRQLWPLEGYLLRETIWRNNQRITDGE